MNLFILAYFVGFCCTTTFNEHALVENGATRTKNPAGPLIDNNGHYIPVYPYSEELEMDCKPEDFYLQAECVGEGTEGCVHKAFHIPTERELAVKLIKPRLEKKLLFMLMVRNEELVQYMVDSPVVVKHYCTFVNAVGNIGFVMEQIKGQTLYDLLQIRSSTSSSDGSDCDVPIETIRKWAGQLVVGLHAIHQANIVFGDLKLENLMVDDNNNMRIVDFGLAFCKNGPPKPFEGIHGTPIYVAPEQIMSQGASLEYEMDWYAFGIVLYEVHYLSSPYSYVNKNLDIDDYLFALSSEIMLTGLHLPSTGEPDLENLICCFCKARREERLGYAQQQEDLEGSLQAILGHPFFNGVKPEQILAAYC